MLFSGFSVELDSCWSSFEDESFDFCVTDIHSVCLCVRSLDVSGCKTVTDAGVRSLALGCRRLEQLDLSSTGTGNRGYDATECFSTSTVT